MPSAAPHGSWESPFSLDLVADAGGMAFGYLDLTEEGVYWTETRPLEDGRTVLVFRPHGGEAVDVVAPGFNVRSRVHEYGGGAWFREGSVVFCSSFEDSRVYRIESHGAEPQPITPEPGEPHGLRASDGRGVAEERLMPCVPR